MESKILTFTRALNPKHHDRCRPHISDIIDWEEITEQLSQDGWEIKQITSTAFCSQDYKTGEKYTEIAISVLVEK